MDVFGARAGPDMAAAIREGRFEFQDLLGVLDQSEGAIMDTAKQTMDFGERWAIISNKITTALEPLGSKMLDVASVVLDALMPAVDTLTPIVGRLSEILGEMIAGFATGEDPIGDIANAVFFAAQLFGVGRDEATKLFEAVIGLRSAG